MGRYAGCSAKLEGVFAAFNNSCERARAATGKDVPVGGATFNLKGMHDMDTYRYEASIRASLAAIADASSTFGTNWSAFKQNMAGDPHVPDLQDAYIEPMLRSQTELLEAIEDMRKSALRFQEASNEASANERAMREPAHPIVR